MSELKFEKHKRVTGNERIAARRKKQHNWVDERTTSELEVMTHDNGRTHHKCALRKT